MVGGKRPFITNIPVLKNTAKINAIILSTVRKIDNRSNYQYEVGKTAVWNDIIQQDNLNIIAQGNILIYKQK